MAKQTQAKQTTPDDLGFLIPVSNIGDKANALIDQIHSLTSRAKYKSTIVIVDNGSTDDTASVITKNKNFVAMEQQGLAKLIVLETKQKASEAFNAASESFNEVSSVVVMDPNMPYNLSGFNAWYGQNSATLDENTVYVGSRKIANTGKEKKATGNIFYNLFRTLLTPIKVHGTDAGFYLMPVSAIKKVGSYLSSKGSSLNIELAYKSSLFGYNLEEFPLASKEGQKFSVNAGTAIAAAFKQRIDWFVNIPISQSFGANKIEKKMSSGSHPIYRLIFMALTVFTFFLLPILSFDYGITWDEPDDIRYFDMVYDYFATGGENQACLDTSQGAANTNKHLIHYGTFVNLACEVADRHLSPFGTYETRHLVISIFSFIGILFVGLIGRRVGNWRLGVLAFVFLLLTPLYFGNGMNNHKDIPFAAFYMASIYFIIRFLSELPRPRFGTMFFLGLCMGIIMSIRVPGVVVFVYFGLFVGVYWLLDARKNLKKAQKLIPSYAKYVLLTLAWAYFIGIILWPYALQDPINHPLESFQKFSQFQFVHVWDIFEGAKKYMKDFIWYYIPKYILITTPLFILAGIAVAVAGYTKFKKMFNMRFINIMFFAALFPIVYAIYKETNLYNSWRQMLFAYPPLVVIAAAGWEWLFNLKITKMVRIGVAVVLAVLVIKPTVWMVQNHPYEYLYYNEIIGGVEGAYGNFELDYWCQTPREAVEWIIENENLDKDKTYRVISNNKTTSSQYYADKMDSGQIHILWSRDQELYQRQWDYAIVTTRTFSHKQLLGNEPPYAKGEAWFPPKGTIHTIDVGGVPVCAIIKSENNYMSEGWRCIEEKKYDSAIVFYNKAIEYNPLEEEAYRNLGLAYLQTRRPQQADSALKMAIALRPENFKALGYMGYVANMLGKPEDAKKYLEDCVKYKVNNSGAYAQLGQIYAQEGVQAQQNGNQLAANQNFQNSLENYEKALMYGGPNVQWYYGLGVAYYQLGKYQEALGYADYCVRMDQKNPQVYLLAAKAAQKIGDNTRYQQYAQAFAQLTGQALPQ